MAVGWKASTTLVHRTVPRAEQRAFPHFVRMLSCRLDLRQTDGACWLHTAQATSTSHGLTGTSTLEADSTASLIDLTCPLTTFTELSAAPLYGGSPSADVSPVARRSFTTPEYLCQHGAFEVHSEIHQIVVTPKCLFLSTVLRVVQGFTQPGAHSS